MIGLLAARGKTKLADADRAAAELGVSRRQVYVLLGKYRQGSGLVTDLAVRRSTGGKGGHRLPEPVEEIIRDLIRGRFLTRQKPSVAALHREIASACAANRRIPGRNHRICAGFIEDEVRTLLVRSSSIDNCLGIRFPRS